MSLLTLEQAAAAGVDAVGGKARGLARLVAIGLPVPPALVLPSPVHERWRAAGRLDDAAELALAAALETLGGPLAVRSSAADEDSGEHSAAGQYESVMGVRDLPSLVSAVEHCYRAAEGERAASYREGTAPRVALVLQREIASDRAGVGFSVDPVTGDAAEVLLEVVFGHGEGAVSGVITPDRFRVARDGGVRARVADKAAQADGAGRLADLPAERRVARTLRDHEARAGAELVLRAEAGFRRPVDVELCFERERLWALQCRPITTLHAG